MAVRFNSKIKYLNAKSWVKNVFVTPKARHISGYTAGYSPNTEFIPVIDREGNFVKKELRSVCESRGLLHPTVHLFLFDNKGRLLVQKRGAGKASSPGKLAQSVGGHVSIKAFDPENIDLEWSLYRETHEELGISLKNYRFLWKYSYISNNEHNKEKVYLFEGRHNGIIRPNYSEVQWAAFFNMEEVRAQAKKTCELFSTSFIEDLKAYDLAKKSYGQLQVKDVH